MNGYSYLTLEQRREIERMYAEGERVVDIAARLKRSAAAIYVRRYACRVRRSLFSSGLEREQRREI